MNTNIHAVIQKINQDAITALKTNNCNLVDICYRQLDALKQYLIQSNDWLKKYPSFEKTTLWRVFDFQIEIYTLNSYLADNKLFTMIVNDPLLNDLLWVERSYLSDILDFNVQDLKNTNINRLPFFAFRDKIELSIQIIDEYVMEYPEIRELDLRLFYDNGYHRVFELILIASAICLQHPNTTNKERVDFLLNDDFIYNHLDNFLPLSTKTHFLSSFWQYIVSKCKGYNELQDVLPTYIGNLSLLFQHAKNVLQKIYNTFNTPNLAWTSVLFRPNNTQSIAPAPSAGSKRKLNG